MLTEDTQNTEEWKTKSKCGAKLTLSHLMNLGLKYPLSPNLIENMLCGITGQLIRSKPSSSNIHRQENLCEVEY